jgi:YggT family protein
MYIIITIINTVVSLLTFFIIVNSIISYFLSPFHPVRRGLNRILDPMLTPIRERLPTSFGFDFSPVVLIILIQLLGAIIIAILRRIG